MGKDVVVAVFRHQRRHCFVRKRRIVSKYGSTCAQEKKCRDEIGCACCDNGDTCSACIGTCQSALRNVLVRTACGNTKHERKQVSGPERRWIVDVEAEVENLEFPCQGCGFDSLAKTA